MKIRILGGDRVVAPTFRHVGAANEVWLDGSEHDVPEAFAEPLVRDEWAEPVDEDDDLGGENASAAGAPKKPRARKTKAVRPPVQPTLTPAEATQLPVEPIATPTTEGDAPLGSPEDLAAHGPVEGRGTTA